MSPGGCGRCGGFHELQVSHVEVGDEDVEIRLCLWCRRKGAEETIDAQARSRARGADDADVP